MLKQQWRHILQHGYGRHCYISASQCILCGEYTIGVSCLSSAHLHIRSSFGEVYSGEKRTPAERHSDFIALNGIRARYVSSGQPTKGAYLYTENRNRVLCVAYTCCSSFLATGCELLHHSSIRPGPQCHHDKNTESGRCSSQFSSLLYFAESRTDCS